MRVSSAEIAEGPEHARTAAMLAETEPETSIPSRDDDVRDERKKL